jgi:GNAT superfamily N-acetyltransferase
MGPLQSKEIEQRIGLALETLATVRNLALDVLRYDDARWIVRREREDLRCRNHSKNEILGDWSDLVRSERELLLREYDWITKHADLNFNRLSQNLADTFWNKERDTSARLGGIYRRVVSDIPADMQRVLHQIPSHLSRQFVIPSYQDLSYLNPTSINPQWLCRLVSEHEARREPPFSFTRLFDSEVKALVLERSGSIVGTVLWDSTKFGEGYSMELLGLWVTPLERRDGVASALIKRAASVALRAGKEFLVARLFSPHPELRELLCSNGFSHLHANSQAHRDTKLATTYRARISDVLRSDECSADIINRFTRLCGGSDVARSLCRARRSLLRLHCPRPSQGSVFKRAMVDLHTEDQLSGKERDITANRNTSQLRFNAKLQSLQAQTREIHRLTSHGHRSGALKSAATRYFSHILSDLSTEPKPDDFCAAVTQLGTVQWKFIPTLSRSSLGHMVSFLDKHLVPHVLDLCVESQHRALISDVKDLNALLSCEEIVLLTTAKKKTLTGVTIGSLIDDAFVFHQLVVDERYRRSGYGRSLVNAMIAQAVYLRCKSVIAMVLERNDAAIKLFASCGFSASLVQVGEAGTPDCYRFSLKLTEQG